MSGELTAEQSNDCRLTDCRKPWKHSVRIASAGPFIRTQDFPETKKECRLIGNDIYVGQKTNAFLLAETLLNTMQDPENVNCPCKI
jgi:hypothetical protein